MPQPKYIGFDAYAGLTHLTMSEAARVLGVSHNSVRSFAISHGLRFARRMGSDRSARLAREALEFEVMQLLGDGDVVALASMLDDGTGLAEALASLRLRREGAA